MAKTKFCQGISDISDTYMGFIIDQWGVLHDGKEAFPDVVDTLKELKKNRNKQILILSNSVEKTDEVKEKLKKMGIGPSLYDKIVTSGDMIWNGLKDREQRLFKDLGNRCYLFNRAGDTKIIDGTDIELVDNIDNADFVLITGSDAPQKTIQDYEPILRKGVQRRLKAFCANADSRALISLEYLMGPGLLARRYEDFGGVVNYIGKPHNPIFQYCMDYLQTKEIYRAETVMVGDTMAHDILGGHAIGIDTCLVKQGLHHGNFRHCQTPRDVDNALKVLMAQYNHIMPTYLIDTLCWGRELPDRKHKRRRQPRAAR